MGNSLINDTQEFEIRNSNMKCQREEMLSLVAACCQSADDSKDCELGLGNHLLYVREGIYFW
ncbi:hypothetical protein PRIP_15042 [Listeria riparia FSL S10-1204]|uniref:Uncharacterized protein n=1 Tax=Listeria riparia FSL S10-1204 TaxID=1265816 RepID=W7D1L3_9LIST|nr:hypothetical protein PRIP_15042 [Listeria riparia FSL S10-1204]